MRRTLSAFGPHRRNFLTSLSLSPPSPLTSFSLPLPPVGAPRRFCSLAVTRSRSLRGNNNTNCSNINNGGLLNGGGKINALSIFSGYRMSPIVGTGGGGGSGDSPPGCRLYWSLTPKDVAEKTDQLIAKCQTVYDSVGGLAEKPDLVNVDSVLRVRRCLV